MKKFEKGKIWTYIFLLVMSLVAIIMFEKSLIISFVILFAIIFLGFKFNIKKFPLVIFLFSFIIRLIVVFFIKTPLESDFLEIYKASQSILNNDYSFVANSYFSTWSYQIGFAFVQSLFLRIFNSAMFLKIINCLISATITLLIYLISKEFSDEKSSKISSIIYAIMPFTITYVTILTNQYLSSLLIYLAIYLIIAKKIKINLILKYVIVGILLAIANLIRPESIIPLFSIILFMILTMNKKNIKSNILNIITTIGTYFCMSLLISSIFISSGIAPDGLKNNDPYWKFVLGFNHDTGGRYSDADVGNIGDKEKEIEVIKERVFTSPIKLAKLFINKIRTFWLNTTLSWSLIHLYEKSILIFGYSINISSIIPIFENINSYIMFGLYIFLILGVYKYVNKKDYNKNILLIITQVFVTFGVYLLIEVQPRYAYHIQISVAVLASLGISELIKFIENKRSKK